ncbi:toxin [Pseudomonas gingeri]|uniref:RHS repeat-associated core domain-containing protein n=1 Tax=Pseudomonas gingeri TaxID=117681 RepID=UPI0015A44180|nr:RHS repeat-associated core domain-containing protein [Pseudomonas gingeri]NWA23487.1 toxin [Pseudomonas gingeri]
MSVLAEGIHTHTPRLTVSDPRGLAVRTVDYCRSAEGAEPEERVNRSAYDAMGRLVEQWDPRLWALSAEDAAAPPNLTNRYSLSGKVLGSLSVDAGERVSLFGDGDQLVQAWDSRGSERWVEYDDLLRPLVIFEQGEDEAPRCTERYEYAYAGADFAAHNQCGQLIRHDDPAGTLTMDEFALTGGVLEQTQRFLSVLEIPNWPQALPERDALLDSVAQAATSSTHFNPLGDVLEQTDAKGNRQQFDYTVDGQLFVTHLQLSAQTTAKTLVSDIHYNAYGQVEQETAGNGVISTLAYRPEDGRLIRLQARHGTEAALQDLHYEYDPVGNVLSIEDAALPMRYFANQRVEPKKQYDYDSLYQLIKATGWEAGTASRGPAFNRFDDPSAVANYQQTYRYDAGGNLLELVHVGPQSHSRKLTAARYSNRCLPEQNDRPPTEDEIAAAFDGNGNLLELQPGQAMSWDLRNQLREVRPVERESSDDDLELYLYGGDGMRRRKVRSTQANARSLISEVRYLPGLEIRTREGTGEVLQVICVQAGRSAMQVLHWETTPPSGIANDQYRYNLTDHLGSSSLELDGEAAVISQEIYHPYGSTAWFAGRSEVEAGYKTVHYSGKERDATGLYYYGYRYYQPWAGRWLSADPAGTVDGLNLFRMCRNNPVTLKDDDGCVPVSPVPKNIWHIWIGPHALNDTDIEHLKSNANKNPDYSITVLTDSTFWSGNPWEEKLKQGVLGRIQVLDIMQTEEGRKFSRSKNYNQYQSAVSSGYAAAGADILRYYWLKERGGIYMDHDDTVNSAFGDINLSSKGIGLSGLYRMPTTDTAQLSYGYSLSHFAVQSGSEVLAQVLDTAAKNFAGKEGGYYENLVKGTNATTHEVLASSGNLLFTKVINENKGKLREYYNTKLKLLNDEVVYSKIDQAEKKTQNFELASFPLRNKVTAGNAHTWMRN